MHDLLKRKDMIKYDAFYWIKVQLPEAGAEIF